MLRYPILNKWKKVLVYTHIRCLCKQNQNNMLLSDFKFFVPAQTRWTDNGQHDTISTTACAELIGTGFHKFLLRLGEISTPVPMSAGTEVIFRKPLACPETPLLGIGVKEIGNMSASLFYGVFKEKRHCDPFRIGLSLKGKFLDELDTTLIHKSFEEEPAIFGNFRIAFVNTNNARPAKMPTRFQTGFDKLVVQ